VLEAAGDEQVALLLDGTRALDGGAAASAGEAFTQATGAMDAVAVSAEVGLELQDALDVGLRLQAGEADESEDAVSVSLAEGGGDGGDSSGRSLKVLRACSRMCQWSSW